MAREVAGPLVSEVSFISKVVKQGLLLRVENLEPFLVRELIPDWVRAVNRASVVNQDS